MRYELHEYDQHPSAQSFGDEAVGRRGLQLELDPKDLVRLTGARVHPIASAR